MVASCWLFLYDLYHDARIHEHQVNESSDMDQIYSAFATFKSVPHAGTSFFFPTNRFSHENVCLKHTDS
jgi:hypothetical protein